MLKTFHCFGRSLLVFNSLFLFSASSTLAQPLPPPPPATDQEVYQFQAPDHSPSNSTDRPLFRVQVDGNSQQLLSLVRQVEPEAFVPQGKNIIQAGLFSDAVNARELVQSLSEQGVSADIIEVASPRNLSSSREYSSGRTYISLSTPTDTATPSSETPEFIPLAVESASETEEKEAAQPSENSTRSYYVVIPSREKNLSNTAEAVQAAGVNQAMILQRSAPRGTHIAVGPFSHRTVANRWRSQLAMQGLNARVYFGR